ncbi:S8 family serine peptidase [Streptomyces sp. NPDC006624]|uniref:S8 family peptidase n=1 Tax=Streptomyces sp. NPDC006624 TaxID=3154892 RepID=UPI0033A172BA
MRTARSTGLSALCAIALGAALVTAPASSAGQSADGPPASAVSRTLPSRTLTLVTGDRIGVDAEGRVTTVRPGEGREDVPIAVRRIGEDTYVVPRDTARLLRKGTLDRRLLNITRLLENDYDDAHRPTLPLIVAFEGAATATRAEVREADGKFGRRLPSIGADTVAQPRHDAVEMWQALTDESAGGLLRAAPGVRRIWLDGTVRTALDRSVPQIGAPEVWKAGYDGTGVKVAVLDTGVDETHPDLAGRQVAERNFGASADTVDRVGHGTHVASTIVGSGEKSDGKYKGVAPGARILDGKVLDDEGYGTDSGIVAGMQWAADEGADVINMSLGGFDTQGIDPLEQAVNALTADKGVLFVVAAGNEGPMSQTVRTPGSAASSLTVGAVDKRDGLADFSSRGPTADGLLKPDLTAPGVDIVAAKAAQGVIGNPGQDGYVSLSGTSMATPHVAGAAALLAQQHPDWTADRIKSVLTASTKEVADLAPTMQGTGRVDAAQSILQTLTASPATLDFGTQQAPHDDDQPVTRTVTYRNDGDRPVTLRLSAKEYTFDGSPDSNGTFSVSPATLTVPAGGTAEAAVTADTSRPADNGTLSSVITATADDGQSVRITGKVVREVDMYKLTLRHTGRNGKATADYSTMLVSHNTGVWEWPYESDGTVTLRLPAGSYTLDTTITTTNGEEITGLDWLAQPLLTLNRDTTVNLDARKARPVAVTVPDTKAVQKSAVMGYTLQKDSMWYDQSHWLTSFKGFRTAHLGAKLPGSQVRAGASAVWQAPGKGSVHTHYRMVWSRTGSMFNGLAQKVTTGQLAKVTVGLGSALTGRTGTLNVTPESAGGPYLGSVAFDQSLPGTSVEYLGGTGARWSLYFGSYTSEQRDEVTYYAPVRTYSPGKSYSERFDTAVTGPSLRGAYSGIRRDGDTLTAQIPLFADGRDHQGDVALGTARTVLYRGGTKIWESKSAPYGEGIPVPAARAGYKLTTDVHRAMGTAATSTRVTAVWTFTSQRPARPGEERVNASVVRFTPDLGLTSTARKGSSVKVPFTVQGAAAGKGLKKITVQVSSDNGRTWKSVKVTTTSSGRYVTVKSPSKAGAVSLRVLLTDTKGGTLTQTVHRAYLVK